MQGFVSFSPAKNLQLAYFQVENYIKHHQTDSALAILKQKIRFLSSSVRLRTHYKCFFVKNEQKNVSNVYEDEISCKLNEKPNLSFSETQPIFNEIKTK